MQSQEFPIAKWSAAQRTEGVDSVDMDRLFAAGAILRTHALRPTWHFVLPEDIRWLQGLTGPRVHAFNAHYYRRMGLDEDLLAKSDVLLAKALEDGRHLTRKELSAELARAGIEASGPMLAYIVMHAELEAIICSGAMRGKQHTYALVEERAPKAKTLDRDEALVELTRRYFTAHGPATLTDYRWWSSLTAADGKRGIAMLGSELERLEVDDRTYWLGATSADVTTTSKMIDLIQVYDELVVSYTQSRDALAGDLNAPDEAGFLHAVLLDGRWIGRWRTVPGKGSVVVETSLLRKLDRVAAKSLDAAVERYGRFLGVPTTLT